MGTWHLEEICRISRKTGGYDLDEIRFGTYHVSAHAILLEYFRTSHVAQTHSPRFQCHVVGCVEDADGG